MISSVLSGRSRPRGSGHTHRTARTGFVVGGCPHRVGERIDRGVTVEMNGTARWRAPIGFNCF